jgi:hypothetical protein
MKIIAMQVRHVACRGNPAAGTMKRDVWVYRTEVTNRTSRRMRVVWFDSYYRDGDQWFGVNSRNRRGKCRLCGMVRRRQQPTRGKRVA